MAGMAVSFVGRNTVVATTQPRVGGKLQVLVAVLALTGCDPGYDYRAIAPPGSGDRWSKTVDGVRFETNDVRTLTGAGDIQSELRVSNQSREGVDVIGGTLTSNEHTLTGELEDGLQTITVPKGSTREVAVRVELHASASKVLGPKIVWTWRIRSRGKTYPVVVEMVRAP